MRRQLLMVLVVAGCLILGAGFVVWAGTSGLFSPNGKSKRLLTAADRAVLQGQLPEAQASLEELLNTYPDSPWADDGLLKLGEVYEQQKQLAEARNTYRLLLEQFPESGLAGKAQQRLGVLNVALLLSPTITDADIRYEVKPGDTLGAIAQFYGTTVELLKRMNELPNDVIRPGQRLKVPKGKFAVVVDKSENQLLLTLDNQFFKLYTVSTGTNNSTPVGTFKIINKIVDPVWWKQGAAVPSNAPENVLGTRWLGFDKPGYGIHGTTDPSAIGQQVTAGCVRMLDADVEELFAVIPMATEVTIVD